MLLSLSGQAMHRFANSLVFEGTLIPYYQQVSEFKTECDLILWASETNLHATVEKSTKKAGFTSHQEIQSSKSSKFSKMLKLTKEKKKDPLPDPSKCPKSTRTGLSCKIA